MELLEVLLQVLFELVADAIYDLLVRSRNPVASTIGTSLFAALFALLAAALSLAIHPTHFIAHPAWRIAALVVFPIANGIAMSVVGRRFIRSGRMRSGYEHFIPAFVFSLVFGVVRYAFAK